MSRISRYPFRTLLSSPPVQGIKNTSTAIVISQILCEGFDQCIVTGADFLDLVKWVLKLHKNPSELDGDHNNSVRSTMKRRMKSHLASLPGPPRVLHPVLENESAQAKRIDAYCNPAAVNVRGRKMLVVSWGVMVKALKDLEEVKFDTRGPCVSFLAENGVTRSRNSTPTRTSKKARAISPEASPSTYAQPGKKQTKAKARAAIEPYSWPVLVHPSSPSSSRSSTSDSPLVMTPPPSQIRAPSPLPSLYACSPAARVELFVGWEKLTAQLPYPVPCPHKYDPTAFVDVPVHPELAFTKSIEELFEEFEFDL